MVFSFPESCRFEAFPAVRLLAFGAFSVATKWVATRRCLGVEGDVRGRVGALVLEGFVLDPRWCFASPSLAVSRRFRLSVCWLLMRFLWLPSGSQQGDV